MTEVIRARLDPMSVGRIRWAPSPVLEAVGWLALAATGRPHPVWGDLGPAARFALRDRAVATTAALVRGSLRGSYMPDFVTPKPDRDAAGDTGVQLRRQLERIRSTPGEVVEGQLRRLASSSPRVAPMDPAALPQVVVTALATFWRQAMADRWTAIRSLLLEQQENQIRAAAACGIGTVLNTLHPILRWQGDCLEVDKPYAEQVHFRDAELVLVPSVVAWPRLVVQVCDPTDAMLAYPVTPGPRRVTRPVEALLGRSRYRVLRHTAVAVSTTELSRTLGMAPSTVSHHLAVLLGAGLVSRARRGRSVLYRRTSTGQRLLDTTT